MNNIKNDGTDLQLWHCRVLWLVAGLLVFRIFYLTVFPLGLIHDEAYYWDWSRHLSLSYYSKGPGVAWTIWASTSLFGHAEWAVRLPAAIASFVTMLVLGRLGQRCFGLGPEHLGGGPPAVGLARRADRRMDGTALGVPARRSSAVDDFVGGRGRDGGRHLGRCDRRHQRNADRLGLRLLGWRHRVVPADLGRRQ